MYLRPDLHRRQALAGHPRSSQRGVVLLVALIILVALTLSGVALIRSVDTANLIAGNQSFHQSAVHAAERSTEVAISWLESNNALGDRDLFDNNAAAGYLASRPPDGSGDPSADESWDAFWFRVLRAQSVVAPPSAPTCPTDDNADAACNNVRYVIQRLCATTGAPHVANCAKQPASISSGGSFGAGGVSPLTNNQVYYRITTRIAGPRNTLAFIQTIVAL
ncbi:MAG: hypothetical protein V5B30_01065 [Candidatus Accumulibacter delftensis]|jgi:type IV pilus assembly protein PilX